MPLPDRPTLTDHLADDIRDRADALVQAWIDWMIEHTTLRPVRSLPREAILDHIPSVLRGIAESLRTPVEAAGIDAAVRSHARLRYDQGYDIEELMEEYRSLTRIVTDRMLHALEQYQGLKDPLEVAVVFVRLAQGLAEISGRTVAVYRQTEVRHRRELHVQLEEYVRMLTHELKQPLHAITSGAGMLEEEGDDSPAERREHYLRIIRNGVERAVKLIDDIRTLAVVEGAQQAEEWALLEASVVLVLQQLSEQAQRRGVRLEVHGPIPPIDIDAPRVEIALVNLVANAIKYADPDKPDRWAHVHVELDDPEAPHRWRVSVHDNGLGIPKELQNQIFERHFRAHPDIDEGTGLGLAITRQVIEQVGGRVWFESEEGRGSSFHFTVVGHENEGAPREARS